MVNFWFLNDIVSTEEAGIDQSVQRLTTDWEDWTIRFRSAAEAKGFFLQPLCPD
jgi:hypothetical protein